MIQQKLEIKGLVLILALVIIVLSWEHVHATLLASGFSRGSAVVILWRVIESADLSDLLLFVDLCLDG